MWLCPVRSPISKILGTWELVIRSKGELYSKSLTADDLVPVCLICVLSIKVHISFLSGWFSHCIKNASELWNIIYLHRGERCKLWLTIGVIRTTLTVVPSWLDSSLGRALYRYRRGNGLESRSGLKFFRLNFHNCSSCVYNCDNIFIT